MCHLVADRKIVQDCLNRYTIIKTMFITKRQSSNLVANKSLLKDSVYFMDDTIDGWNVIFSDLGTRLGALDVNEASVIGTYPQCLLVIESWDRVVADAFGVNDIRDHMLGQLGSQCGLVGKESVQLLLRDLGHSLVIGSQQGQSIWNKSQ